LLNAAFIKVSGSFTARINGSFVSDSADPPVWVYVSASRSVEPESGMPGWYESLGYGNGTWSGTTCSWALGMEAQEPSSDPVDIVINISDNSVTETLTLGSYNNNSLMSKAYSFIVLSGTVGTVTADGHTPEQVQLYAKTSDDNMYWTFIKDGNDWEIHLPGNVSVPLDIGVEVFYAGSYYSQNVTTWTSGNSYTGIDLGPVDISMVTLSGTIDPVTVNGNPAEYVSIYAEPSDYSNIFPGSVDTDSGIWQIGLPSGYSGELTIRIGAYYELTQCQQDAATLMVYGSSVSNINLGNKSFVTLSGTFGTVTVNGSPPSEGSVYAKTSDGQRYWSYGANGSAWRIGIPGNVLGTLTIGGYVKYGEVWYEKDITTRTFSGSPITGINLGDIAITLKPISGTVTTNGSILLSGGQLYVFDPSGIPDFNSQPLGEAEISGGAFSGLVSSDVTTGYVVIFDASNPSVVYITQPPVSINSSMSLNLLTMASMSIP
jgi:hypothetical protein